MPGLRRMDGALQLSEIEFDHLIMASMARVDGLRLLSQRLAYPSCFSSSGAFDEDEPCRRNPTNEPIFFGRPGRPRIRPDQRNLARQERPRKLHGRETGSDAAP